MLILGSLEYRRVKLHDLEAVSTTFVERARAAVWARCRGNALLFVDNFDVVVFCCFSLFPTQQFCNT